MDIYLAKTQGFCAGVTFAINIVEKALEKYGPPLYVYHEIVHNTFVINRFREQGVTFVDKIEDVPFHEKIIFSAHGVAPSVIQMAEKRKLQMIDATCPLVAKVHREAVGYSQKGYPVFLVGHKGHQEVKGTAGYVKKELLHIIEDEKDLHQISLDPQRKVAYITQTTLSLDDTSKIITALNHKFNNLESPHHSDICYATQTRQDAVKELAEFCDVMLICGSKNSSNTNRLKEASQKLGVSTYMIDSVNEIDFRWLKNQKKIGISSGASVPQSIVDALIVCIQSKYEEVKVHTFENPEKDVVFPLPEI